MISWLIVRLKGLHLDIISIIIIDSILFLLSIAIIRESTIIKKGKSVFNEKKSPLDRSIIPFLPYAPLTQNPI